MQCTIWARLIVQLIPGVHYYQNTEDNTGPYLWTKFKRVMQVWALFQRLVLFLAQYMSTPSSISIPAWNLLKSD